MEKLYIYNIDLENKQPPTIIEIDVLKETPHQVKIDSNALSGRYSLGVYKNTFNKSEFDKTTYHYANPNRFLMVSECNDKMLDFMNDVSHFLSIYRETTLRKLDTLNAQSDFLTNQTILIQSQLLADNEEDMER